MRDAPGLFLWLASIALVALVVPQACAAHISEVDGVPTIVTVPELRVRRPGFHKLPPGNGTYFGLSHSFVGTTDVGFVDYHYSVLQKPNSIHAEDYADLFTASVITCSPIESGDAPHRDANGSLIRNNVHVSFAFATPTTAEEAALAHFLARATDTGGAFLTFDHAVLAESPSFAPGTACAEQLPWEASAYAITDAFASSPLSLALDLSPVHAREAHAMMNVTLKWDPNATREVARRLDAGEPIGRDARRRLAGRALSSTVGSSKSISLNWNGVIGPGAAAERTPVEAVPAAAGLLTCTNCFAYLAVGYAVTFQFCIGVDVASVVYFYTSEDPDGNMGYSVFGGVSSATTLSNMADCVASLAPWDSATAASPINYYDTRSNPDGIDWTHPGNAAFNVDAYVNGGAGFNFHVTSSGFTGSGSTASCGFAPGSTDSSACTNPTLLFDTNGPAFTIPIATGVTAGVGGRLSAAAIYSGSLKCALSVGAGAGASAKLGGTAQVTDMRSLVSGTIKPSLSAYKQFDLTYSSSPLTASFTSASGSLDATFFIDVILTLDSSIPITATAALHFATAMSAGSAAVPTGISGGGPSSSSGLGSGGSSAACVASASTTNGVFYGTLCFGTSCTSCSSAVSCVCPPPVRRELQLNGQSPPISHPWSRRLDSLATCPRTGTYFAASTQGLVGVKAGPTDLRTLITGVSAASGYTLNSAVASWVPSTQLLALTTVLPPTANGPLQPLVAACVAGGTTLSGSVGGPNAVALTSTGGGTNGGSSAGSSGGGSTSDSSSCGLGCVAAIVVVMLMLVCVVVGIAVFVVLKGRTKPTTASVPPRAVANKGRFPAIAVTNPSLVVNTGSRGAGHGGGAIMIAVQNPPAAGVRQW